MHILITSGGTKVPIDDVRHVDMGYIGNFSGGRFAAAIIESTATVYGKLGLAKNLACTHLHNKASVRPAVQESPMFYSSRIYETYDEYVEVLHRELANDYITFVFLAAAVSDFAPDPIPGKIDSSTEKFTLTFHRLPKVIQKVRGWSQNKNIVQIGFKLLSNVSEEELLNVGQKARTATGSDLTIANDLRTLKNDHQALLISEFGHRKYSVAVPWLLDEMMMGIYARFDPNFMARLVENRGVAAIFSYLKTPDETIVLPNGQKNYRYGRFTIESRSDSWKIWDNQQSELLKEGR